MEKRIEILGKTRIVPVMCNCKRTKFEELKAIEDNKEKQYRLERVMSNSLMDKTLKKMTFENWDNTNANPMMAQIAKKYAEKFEEMKKENIGLIVHGEPGNGKTYMSGCIANYLLNKSIPVICVGTGQLLQRIQQTFNSYGKEGTAEILRGVNEADLLILDDLGAEQHTEWSIATIYQIIDSRYRSNKPIIVTTSIPLADIERYYDKRTYDRLVNQMCTPIHNKWKSLREKLGGNKINALKKLLQ